MADLSKTIVYAHSEGIARLAFSPDGRVLYTSGAEGYVRVFDVDLSNQESFDPKLIDYHEEPVTCLSTSNDFVASANESGVVAIHQNGTNEFVQLVTRCSFPVRSARFDPKGKRIAVASDELIVKVIDAKDPLKVQLLPGHKKAVREASWSPDGSMLATSGSDGQIRIWELKGAEPTCIHVLDGIIPAADPESEHTVEVVWHPSGKYFVVAGKSNELVIISTDSWSKTGSFAAKDGHTSEISSLVFSPNGAYLASAAKDGSVLIWSAQDRRIVNRTTHTHGLITGIAFHPSPQANLLAFIDFSGQLTRWKDPIPANLIGPSVLPRGRSVSVAPSAVSRSGGAGGEEKTASEFGGELDDEGWLEDDDAHMGGVGGDTGHDDLEDDGIVVPARLGGASSYTAGRERGSRSYQDFGSSSSHSSKGQVSFQPGSTPFREQRRYLAFNMLGLIHVVEREDQNIVTIEFHDRSAQTGTHFNDTFKFTLGALGELGAGFACRGTAESPSLVHYRSFETWTASQEWQYSLPYGENALVIAVGGLAPPPDELEMGIAGTGTVLVATDKGYVRFLTGSGLQKYLWNLGEEVISMAAGKDWALVVYRGVGGVVDGRQNLEYALIDTDSYEVVQQGKLPLIKGASLNWIGFTDEQIPAMYDSNGVFSLLDRSRRPRQARWVPTLDTNTLARREGKQESYWPVGLTDQHAHVIILKGEDKYPHFPTPLFQELDLQLPLLRLDVQGQGQLEEKYLRESLFISHRRDGADPTDHVLKAALARQELDSDKQLLIIIQTACKSERLETALDAALLLTQPASIAAAAKIARFFNLPGLEERIQLVEEAKTGIRKFEDENKRGAKWAHLVDDRTIIAPPRPGEGGRRSNLFGGATMDSPSSSTFTPRGSSVFGTARTPASTSKSARKSVNSVGKARDDSVFEGSDGLEMDESMDVDEDEGADWQGEDDEERSPKRARSKSRSRSSSRSRSMSEDLMHDEPEEMAPPPKKAVNPFAKRAAAAKADPDSSSPAGPFASKKGGKTNDIQRTGSFFNRVEGKEAPKTKTKAGRPSTSSKTAPVTTGEPGSRQTTLFGLAPPAPAEKGDKKTKKRKSMATEEEDGDDPIQSKGKGKEVEGTSSAAGLKSFLKPTTSTAGLGGTQKELPREGEEFVETQGVESQDTQPPQPRRSESGSTEVIEEEEEEEIAETQEATQVETQDAQVPEKENVAAKPTASSASKLEKFRRPQAAAEVVPAAAVAVTTESPAEESSA